jgi:predicted dinucleotide-binding enzyme
MKIGIIRAGRIGGGIATQLAGAGRQLKLSVSRDPRCTVRNDHPAVVAVLIVSAPRSSGAEPMGWA